MAQFEVRKLANADCIDVTGRFTLEDKDAFLDLMVGKLDLASRADRFAHQPHVVQRRAARRAIAARGDRPVAARRDAAAEIERALHVAGGVHVVRGVHDHPVPDVRPAAAERLAPHVRAGGAQLEEQHVVRALGTRRGQAVALRTRQTRRSASALPHARPDHFPQGLKS